MRQVPGIEAELLKMFDDVVLLDDRIVADGKAAGREDGKARGFKEGDGMGRGKGFRTLAEMGFYRGCCLAWLALNREDPGVVMGMKATHASFFCYGTCCLIFVVRSSL